METKVQKSEIKKHIEIEGIILSPEAIETLKCFQEHNNEELDSITNSLNEAVCLIIEIETSYGNDFDKYYPEAYEIMRGLVFARKQISKLKTR